MNKMCLIKNPKLFQGEKYLSIDKNYFEGWYFKNTTNNYSISFIPGINVERGKAKSFIQVITSDSSYFINYNINDFKFNTKPFYIKIGNNFFSENSIHIDIFDDIQNIKIKGNINYSNNKNISTNILNPNIMGPFSYIPNMECNHAILSMRNNVNGQININDRKYDFYNGIGYIEKDWGCSFPKSYIWCQGNNFKKTDASFMISIANIPFKILEFRGLICVLNDGNKEYKFTTYNNAKIEEYNVNNNSINITLKKGKYYLNIKSQNNVAFKLSAPIKGRMKKDIYESISSQMALTLKRGDDIIFNDISVNCGLEVVEK